MAIIKLLLPHFRMDKFIVSARKYRPQNFSTVIGQSHITTTLKMPLATTSLPMHFYFAGQEEWVKLPVPVYLPKPLTAKKN